MAQKIITAVGCFLIIAATVFGLGAVGTSLWGVYKSVGYESDLGVYKTCETTTALGQSCGNNGVIDCSSGSEYQQFLGTKKCKEFKASQGFSVLFILAAGMASIFAFVAIFKPFGHVAAVFAALAAIFGIVGLSTFADVFFNGSVGAFPDQMQYVMGASYRLMIAATIVAGAAVFPLIHAHVKK